MTKLPGIVYDENQIGQWVIEQTGVVYIKNQIGLLGPIWSSAVCDENQLGQRLTDYIGAVYDENDTELPWLIELAVVYFQN